MRLTVGPLPSAVYWRRRAIVLGGLLIVILLLAYSCGGSGDSPKSRTGSGAGAGGATSPTATAGTSASPTTTVTGKPSPAVVDPPDKGAGAGITVTTAPTPTDNTCADAEMLLTPVPGRPVAQRGQAIQLYLKIRNIGHRTCRRDVGADLQELRMVAGAVKVWSSDDCNPVHGSDPRWFTPNFERQYEVTWNGHSSVRCGAAGPVGPVPPPGQYQLIGRLNQKLSNPIAMTLTG